MATTAKYPASLAALVDFGADTADLVTAVLSGSHNASVTTITLTATVPSQWPTAGWVTIDGEIIKYAGKSGSTLTSCTRGDQSSYGGGIASTHNDQSIVGAYLTAQQVNQIVAEVIALETYFAPGGAVATIASAGTTDLSTVAKQYIQVTGTTTITAFGTVLQGEVKILEFAGALTLTHNASSLILRSAANATTAAGDVYAFVSEGSGNWREVWHLTAAATSASDITLGTEQATTSGTSITFTGIPSWAKRITVNLVGVSTSGTSVPMLRIGPSGGVETTGYSGAVSNQTGGSVGNISTGFDMETGSGAASIVFHGTYTLTLEKASTNTWVATWILARSDAAGVQFGGGSKSLAGTLDRVALTTAGGTDTFDLGAANITYE